MIILISLRKGKETMKKIMIVNFEKNEEERILKEEWPGNGNEVVSYLTEERNSISKIINEKTEKHLMLFPETFEKEENKVFYAANKFQPDLFITDTDNVELVNKIEKGIMSNIIYIFKMGLESRVFSQVPAEIERKLGKRIENGKFDLSEWDIYFKFKGKDCFKMAEN